MSKHTPGPWFYIGDIVMQRSSRRVICDVSRQYFLGNMAHSKRMIPDALLISAAPDLLQALQCLLNASMHKNHPIESDMAIAAIARATGEPA